MVSHVTVLITIARTSSQHHQPAPAPAPARAPLLKTRDAAFALTNQNNAARRAKLRRTVKTLRLATYRCVGRAQRSIAAKPLTRPRSATVGRQTWASSATSASPPLPSRPPSTTVRRSAERSSSTASNVLPKKRKKIARGRPRPVFDSCRGQNNLTEI